MRFTLHGARLVDAASDIAQGDLVVEDTRIAAVGTTPQDTVEQIIDASDCIVLPGFIEVHTHGGGGFNLHTTDASEIRSYACWIPATGVTSFLVNDGTLTGSVLTLDKALHNMLVMTHSSLSEISAMLSWNAARSVHLANHKGRLLAGYDADLVIYDQQLNLQATICRGQLAYVSDAWRQRLLKQIPK